MPTEREARVVSVSRGEKHTFSKKQRGSIELVEGSGVEGDAHFGRLVQHRLLQWKNPLARNLRQVHLVAIELLEELSPRFHLGPGDLGENVTTRGIDLCALPRATRLHLGEHAVVEITGLRRPCKQIERFRSGLLHEVVSSPSHARPRPRVGVMGIVLKSGAVREGDLVGIELPLVHEPLGLV